MNFGAAIIHPPVAKPKAKPRGRAAPTYDCGSYGRMTIAQMAKLAGVSVRTIEGRMYRGARREALVVAKLRPKHGPTTPVIGIACILAARFPNRVPTVKEIRKARPMSLAVAYRWQRAWREALAA